MKVSPQSKRKKWECLFCFKKVGNDRKTRICTEGIFKSCFRHLSSDIIGKTPSFEDFQNNNGPFCAPCFQSAQQLSKKNELLTIVEKEIGDFVTSLTVSILENRNASVTTPFDYESNIEIQMMQKVDNYAIEIREQPENSAGIFDCYEEEVQEIEVQQHSDVIPASVAEDEEEVLDMETDDHDARDDSDNICNAESDDDEVQEIEKHEKKARGSYVRNQYTQSNTNQVVMKNVVLRTTQSGKVFLTMSCECGMTFESDKQMKEHAISCAKTNTSMVDATKTPDIRYRCGICGFLAKTIEDLREHKVMRHGKKYACKKCEQKFRLKVKLKAHIRSAHPRDRFQCSTCGKSYVSEKFLLDHEEEHKSSPEKPKGRICDLCGTVCATKTMLNYHMIAKHTDQRPYECSVCQKTFKLSRFLDMHMQTHQKVKDFLCGDKSCGKSFATFRLLDQHNKLEHTDDNFKCDLCDFKTLIQKKLDIHKGHYHDPSKKYECSYCRVRVSTRNTLENHERIHTGEKPHECSTCGESFRTTLLLKLHNNKEHSEKKFKCSKCDFVAAAQFLLDSHSLVHSEDKPFECEGCGKTFKCKSSMVKHERLTCKVRFTSIIIQN